MKIAFLGLGVMGYPMAGHLVNAGHEVTVFNRSSDKAEQWAAEYKGRLAETPQAAVIDADMVMACVGKDDHLRALLLGDDGAFSVMKTGSVFIDHTTASAQIAREFTSRGTVPWVQLS